MLCCFVNVTEQLPVLKLLMKFTHLCTTMHKFAVGRIQHNSASSKSGIYARECKNESVKRYLFFD